MPQNTIERSRTTVAYLGDGTEVLIDTWTRIFRSHTSAGDTRTEGTSDLKTRDGLPVAYVAKGRYEIIDDDGQRIPVHSDDPDAP
jgi:hypothetical protein